MSKDIFLVLGLEVQDQDVSRAGSCRGWEGTRLSQVCLPGPGAWSLAVFGL